MPGIKKGMLSICLLGYNHARYIEKSLEAIWQSDYKNIEIIVVDDGSMDDSAKILLELSKKSPFPMKVILQQNTGNIGYNNNLAIRKSSGEFISFISLDDVLYSDKIGLCIRELISNPSLAFIASSKITTINDAGISAKPVRPLKIDGISRPNINDLLDLEYSNFGAFYIQGVYWRTKIIKVVRGFDEDIIGDDIVLRTKVFKYIKENPEWKFKIIREPTCYYRQHENNISRNGVRQLKIVTQYLDKYWENKPNPQILLDWFISVSKNLSFKEILAIFTMNKRATSLMSEPKILDFLIKKIKKEFSIWNYIYCKKKNGNDRTIRLFAFLKIHYKRKRKF